MSKSKNKNKNRQLPPVNVNYGVYTEDAYYKVYSDHTEENYEEACDMYMNPYRLIQTMEESCHINIESIKFVVVDEEYFDWLNINNLEENQVNRLNYITSMNEEDIKRLWVKNEKDKYILNMCMPVTFFNENISNAIKNEIELSNNLVNNLKTKITKCMNLTSSKIYIHNKMYKPNVINAVEEEIYSYYFEIFNNYMGSKFEISNWIKDNVKEHMSNVFMRMIPIGYCDIYSYKYTKEEAKNKEEENFDNLDSRDFDEEINTLLQTEFKQFSSVSVFSSLILTDMAEDYYDSFIKTFTRHAKKNNITISNSKPKR